MNSKVRIDKVIIYREDDIRDDEEGCFIGIWAEAEVSYPIGGGNRRLEKFRSRGLWGIEYDGPDDEDYAKSVEKEEIADLKYHLRVFGIDTKNFPKPVSGRDNPSEAANAILKANGE